MSFKPPTHTQRFRAIEPTKELDDNLDRLTLAEYTIDGSNEFFTIDDLGNRTSVNVRDGNNVAYSVDNLTNRYNSVGGNSLTYDKAGNLTTDKDGYKYSYDYENRIIKITKDPNDTVVAELAYDALGRRIRKIDSDANETTLYYYNYNWQVLCEYNGSGTQQRFYIYGNYIDEVLFMYRFSPIARCYYVHDHLYSPAALIDNSGNVCERYEYDAYGNPYILEPNFAGDPDGQSDYENPYLFTGRQADFLDGGNLVLQDNRHRSYDYYTGRWLTRDPKGTDPAGGETNWFGPRTQYSDGVNTFEYVGSEPTRRRDPQGLSGGHIPPGPPGGGRGGGGPPGAPPVACNRLRHIVDRIRIEESMGFVDCDSIRELYRLLAMDIFHPHAARILSYWLSGGSEDREIPGSLISSDLRGAIAIAILEHKIKKSVLCKDFGITPTFSKKVFPIRGTDFFFATGDFTLKAEGIYRKTWLCGGCKRKTKAHFWMRDPYDWEPGWFVRIPGCPGVIIEDDWALELKTCDGLHTFDVYADWTEDLVSLDAN